MRSALVTGAAGFIGSHLVDTLLDEGWKVTGLDDFSTGTRSNLSSAGESFELVEGDLRDEAALETAIEGVDVVFHHAAAISVPESIEHPARTTDVNCTGTAKLLEAARDEGVCRVILASSAAVYGSDNEVPVSEEAPTAPESPYALSKRYTEQLALQYAEQYELDAIALRYFNVFGPRQNPEGEYAAVIPQFIQLMIDGQQPVIYGDGEQSRDFVYVDDVMAANLAAATADCAGEIFNIAGGSRITINELVKTINEVLGTALHPKHDDPRPGDVRHSQASISKAESMLGYSPTVDLETGLRETAAQFDE
ncbi:SDR family oxidoreductase [Halorubrum pallidum]|uniref:SDR family oxidoreductase n=1 Tax=Halorubrum pallidum TaxID=1526114 RepID=A0ABD5T1A3_9EURY